VTCGLCDVLCSLTSSLGPEPGGMALRMSQRVGGTAMKKTIMLRESVSTHACRHPSTPFCSGWGGWGEGSRFV
jgi:hypothetical protein